MRHLLLLLVILVSSANSAYAADANRCPNDKAAQADDALVHIKQWSDFYTVYKNYAVCDNAHEGEEFSDAAAKMLANHWDQIGAFITLADKDQGFKDFIIWHIDETDDLNDINRIISNAHNMCPTGAKRLCRALEVQATHPDISGWLGLYASKQKAGDGGHAVYLPEDDVFAIGDLTGERKDDLAVAFTLGGINGANDWSRYVAVFTKMSVNSGEEYEYCCMYQISMKGKAANEKIRIQDREIEMSSPSLHLKVQGLSLIKASEHKKTPQ